MASSDIIKIGFDYRSSLAQFEKDTNGVFDGISSKAGKQKITIQLDAKDDKVIDKIKELQKLKLDKFTFEFGNSGLKEQLQTFDKLENKINEIINLSKGIGNSSAPIVDVNKSSKEIDKLENKISELNKKYDELQKKSATGGISGKEVNLVDNDEFKKLSQEVSELKDQFDDLKTHMSLLDDYTVPTDRFFELQTQVEATSVKVSNLVDEMTRLSNVQKNIGVETNISLSSDSTVEQQIKSESELNAEIEKRENIIRELQQLQEKLTVHEDFHSNDRYFADQLPTEEEIREADKRIKQLTGSNNIFNVDKLIQDRNEWLSEVKYSLEEYDDLIKANDQKALDEYTTRGLSRIGGAESFFGYEDNSFSIASKFVEEKEKIQNEINDLYIDLDKLDEKMNLDSNNSSVDNTIQSQEKLRSELKETQKQAEKTAQAVKKSTATASTEQKKDAFPDKDVSASVETATNSIKEENNVLEQNTQKSKENAEAKEKIVNADKKVSNVNLSKYNTRLESYNKKTSGYDATIARFEDGGWTSDDYKKRVDAVKEAVKQYEDVLNNLKKHPELVTEEELDKLDKQEKLIKENITAVQNMSAAEKGYSLISAQKELDKINNILKEHSGMSREAKNQIKAYYAEIKSGNPSASLDVIHGKIIQIVNAESDAGRAGKSMWSVIKEKAWYGVAGAIGTYFGFNDILRYGGEVVNTVKDLNTQITELAKVSGQSSKQIYSDFDSYADIAKEVRGTISDTIAATADWSKNGYSIPDAKELAEISQLYKNVGDGINIDEANESLISTLKGFKLEANEAEHIVDVFNEVSNNEAISSTGIGDALQRSAASFNAANTSLEKSVALVTATNSVLQDPEKVGNMWKTVSARIRGAKTELTNMGEDTDGLVESTSKLQALVKGITGVDILESDGKTFKDIYTIVSGISEKWATLSDIDRASLLESLAGKNQSNALAAALSQPEILKKAYEEATNAEGSARRENEEYAKSVQASIDLTKAKLEELSNDLLSSDFLKGAIDAGGKLIDILDEIVKSGNAIPTVFTAISAALSFKNVGIGTLVAY